MFSYGSCRNWRKESAFLHQALNPPSAPCLNPLSNSSPGCSGEVGHFSIPCSTAPQALCSQPTSPLVYATCVPQVIYPILVPVCTVPHAMQGCKQSVCCGRLCSLQLPRARGSSWGTAVVAGKGKPHGVQQWLVIEESLRPSWGWGNAIISSGAHSPVHQGSWIHWTSEVQMATTKLPPKKVFPHYSAGR